MSKTFEEHRFKAIEPNDLVCSVWFERDRQYVGLSTPSGKTIFDLWDDDVSDAIESGFLPTPRHPRPSAEQWHPCAVEYAKSVGLLSASGHLVRR